MITAFIPVRGGSKSIPLKNIKSFCGKPLVYWNIKALEDTAAVDKIIVATDAKIIEDTVNSFPWKKMEIYHRSSENACDTASTESVMLEYLAKAGMKDSDIFMLVQATSPLTESVHFSEALDMYQRGDFDSILTCVRNYRFFWNDDGTPMNYDYRNRPRRQNFRGMYMENGAFYINTVENILRDKNRLSGRIGIYEMPEYTATEIDEPDDWAILENLKYRYMSKEKNDYNKIKLFLSDVDGVLTDGGMYYSEKGDELKKFNTRDGMAFQLMRERGIKTGIITSEDTQIVERRSEKLKLDFCVQGKREGGKLAAAEDICKKLGVALTETAYVGDDINDIDLLQKVGFPFCPADAQQNIKKIVNIVILDVPGGNAVVRRIWDLMLNAGYK